MAATLTSISMTVEVAVYREADGRYSAFATTLKGCLSWGDTPDEAVERFRDAAAGWLAEWVACNGATVDQLRPDYLPAGSPLFVRTILVKSAP